jgi:DNA anti-recombination protein RmuC
MSSSSRQKRKRSHSSVITDDGNDGINGGETKAGSGSEVKTNNTKEENQKILARLRQQRHRKKRKTTQTQIHDIVRENARKLQNLEADVSQLTQLMVKMEQTLSTCVRMLAINMYPGRNHKRSHDDDRGVSVDGDEHIYSSFSDDGSDDSAESVSSL